MATSWICRRLLKPSSINKNFLKPPQSVLLEQKAEKVTLTEYNKKGTDEPERGKFVRRMDFVLRNLVPETKKYIEEQKLNYTTNPMLEADHGNYQVVFR